MKTEALSILLNSDFVLDKKFYLISGNETTLMEKVCDTIIERYKQNNNTNVIKIDSIKNLQNEVGLFENHKIYLGKNCKGVDEKNLNEILGHEGVFIFIQENSKKNNIIKKYFLQRGDSYLIDCYELDKSSKNKILNNFLGVNNFNISKEIYWFLIDKLDNRFLLFESDLKKILGLNKRDIQLEEIKKLITVDSSSKEKIFFNILKKNDEIIQAYREKIVSTSDVNDLYYYCKFFCHLIIDSNNEGEYVRKIPRYLFKERVFLIDIYKKYNVKKKKMLLALMDKTEKILRKESGLSVLLGLRFLLSIKKITIS